MKIALALTALAAAFAGLTGSSSPLPHPGQPPWPIVVPYAGSSCSAPDTGLRAYLPLSTGLADGSKVLTCNGHSWS